MFFCRKFSFPGDLQEIYGISTGYVREMFEQHLPLLKPFTHFTGNVAQFYEIHDKYRTPQILFYSLGAVFFIHIGFVLKVFLYFCKLII